MDVYLLHHERDLDGCDDVKLVGVYATEDDAEAAKARARLLPGFSEHADGFSIARYRVGADGWTTGFVTVRWDADEVVSADKAA